MSDDDQDVDYDFEYHFDETFALAKPAIEHTKTELELKVFSSTLKRNIYSISVDFPFKRMRRDAEYIAENVMKRVSEAYNSGNIVKLKTVVDEFCTEDCVVVSPLGVEHPGRKHLMSMWSSAMEAFPDSVLLSANRVEIKNGVVFVKGYFSGTKVVGGDWERYMTMPQGGHTIANLVDKIEKDGQFAKIFRKGWIECHLNPEQTGIVRWVKHTYVFDVKPQSMSIW